MNLPFSIWPDKVAFLKKNYMIGIKFKLDAALDISFCADVRETVGDRKPVNKWILTRV